MRDTKTQTENQVTLQLPDYLSLYEFNQNIGEKKLVLRRIVQQYWPNSVVEYIPKETAWDEIGEANKSLQKEINTQAETIERLRNQIRELTRATPANIKQFSIWQFIMWRRKK